MKGLMSKVIFSLFAVPDFAGDIHVDSDRTSDYQTNQTILRVLMLSNWLKSTKTFVFLTKREKNGKDIA